MEFYLMLVMRDDPRNSLKMPVFSKRKYREIRLKVVVQAVPSVQRHCLEKRPPCLEKRPP